MDPHAKEALIALGLFGTLAFAIMFLIARIIAAIFMRGNPVAASQRVTKWGWLAYGLLVPGLILFFAAGDLLSEGSILWPTLIATLGVALILGYMGVKWYCKSQGLPLIENTGWEDQ